MNMLGFFSTPEALGSIDDDNDRPEWQKALFKSRFFILLVLLPVLILAIYYYAMASDQYESEAEFIVSASNSGSQGPASGIGSMLGLGVSQSQSQANSVPEYLRSHDALAMLGKKLPLVQIFRRPGTDFASRIFVPNPTPETLLRYYQGKVKLVTDHDTGITKLTVRAFRQQDAYAIARTLLDIGEQQVNAMNERSYRDAVALAEKQMKVAIQASANVQRRITAFRQIKQDVDPEASGGVQIRLVSDLRAKVAAAEAQLATMRKLISVSSPQYLALESQIASYRAQLATQSSRLTGGENTIASNLGGYEALRVQQEFSAKQYDAAAASLEKAREEAQRQQLYLVRVVDANLPVKSLYPQRGKILLTVFLAFSLAYGIGWLILAGVKEHVA